MSGIYKIWLVDKAPGNDYYWGEGTRYMIGVHITEYFNTICKKNQNYSNSDFSWSGNGGQVQDTELVVYFLASQEKSIIRKRFNVTSQHASGGTYPSPAGMISEVYVNEMEGDRNYSRLVANCAFHEILHNKLDASSPQTVSDIHSLGNNGLSSPTVSSGMRPSSHEINLMANTLSKSVIQYTRDM